LSSTPRSLGALVAVGALVALASACGSTSTATSTSGSTGTVAPITTVATTGSTAPGGTVGAARTVTVTLGEWALEPSATTISPGTVTFVATNKGATTHELVLFKTDLPADALPLDEEGAVDERASGVELVEEVEDVKKGQTKSFTVDDLPAGSYVLVCNLVEDGEKHYGHAMYAPFTVA
jgi:plastocyanin